MPTLMNISQNLFNVINENAKAKKCINFRDLSARYMCDIIGEVAFGLECNLLFIHDNVKCDFDCHFQAMHCVILTVR